MENYTLNYHQTFSTDLTKSLQTVFDLYSGYYMQDAIQAFGSLHSKENATKIDFATPAHQKCFIDYVLFEQQIQKQKAYQIFIQQQTEAPEVALLNKFIPCIENSYTSLFRVIDVDTEEGMVYFDDVLGVKEGQEIAILDKTLTDTIDAIPENMNLLMFFRFIPYLGDFIDLNEEEDTIKGMSSGYFYFFNPTDERLIRKEYEKLAPLARVAKNSSKRQVVFSELDKKYGKKLALKPA